MSLDPQSLASSMLQAALGTLTKQAPGIGDYAKSEFGKIASTIAMIEKMVLSGSMTEDEAKLHLQIQANASRAVLLTVEGLGLLAAEAAINAGLNAVKGTVNAALPFALL